jgi:hypothetical protein
MPIRLLRPLLVALALLGPAVSSLGATATSPYGVNAHAPQGQDLARLFDQLQAAGVGWVRIDFEWTAIEPQQDVFHWQIYDAIVAAAELRGLEVLGILAYTPAWATDGEPRAGVPRQVADWEDVCFRAAARYRGRVRAWEIWNEPNLDRFFAGSRTQYIERILEPGARAVRAADPGALVGGPGLAHLTSGDSDWYRWLLDVLERAGDELDFVSHHLYDRDGDRDVTRKLNDSTTFGDEPELWDAATPSVREVLREGGWQGRPFWLTETGWASDQVGEPRQADYYRGFLEEWLTGRPGRTWIHKVFFYELRDDPTPGIPKWGLLRADRSPKPAFAAYRDFIAAHPPPGPPELALLGGRFGVKARWRRPNGASGVAEPVPYSDQTGLFWFFQPANIELLVKILDGRPVNGHFWVLFGALSNVEYWLDVTDRTTGETHTYHNPPGTYCGQADTAVPAAAHAIVEAPLTPPTCFPSSTALCLESFGRFRVEVEFRDPRSGLFAPGHAVEGTGTSGYFWFFRPENLELVVKVLDGQTSNAHYWFFWGALSNVEYRITVTDTFTGEKQRYHNRRGSFCGGSDTQAF